MRQRVGQSVENVAAVQAYTTLWPELKDIDLDDLWFQQDGATSHTAHNTIDLLKSKFDERVI